MFKSIKTAGLILGIICTTFFVSHSVMAQESDSVDVDLSVKNCNNNSICEINLGETENACPLDCGSTVVPPPPPPGEEPVPGSGGGPGGGRGYSQTLTIQNVNVKIGADFAIISWETSQPSLSNFAWGETTEYERGSLSQLGYYTRHSIQIQNLLPGKIYYFKIRVVNQAGAVAEINNQSLSLPALFGKVPTNVSRVRVSATPTRVIIEWLNPADFDFKNVRVMRSESFYPDTPSQGKLIYENSGEKLRDTNVVPGVTYYYTIFSHTKKGEYSSGALVKVRVPFPKEDTGILNPFPFFPSTGSTTALYGNNFEFFQEGIPLRVREKGDIIVDGFKGVTVSVQKKYIPKEIKLLTINLQDQNNDIAMYQFRQSGEQYVVELPPTVRAGKTQFRISLYGGLRENISNVDGTFVSVLGTQGEDSFWTILFGILTREYYLFFIILFIILILIFIRQKKRQS